MRPITILRMPAVRQKAGYASSTSVYNGVRNGTFTQPVQIGPKTVGWPEHEVDAINAARIGGVREEQLRELVKKLHSQRAELLAAVLA
jgi:prophage regulatory protein